MNEAITYNKDKALIETMKKYPSHFGDLTLSGITRRDKKLEKIRRMRYEELKTLQDIGDSFTPKITRQAVKDILDRHFPLEGLIKIDAKARGIKALKSEFKLKVGTKVWFRLPANGVIVGVTKGKGYTINIGEIRGRVQFFKDDELEAVN